MDVGFVNKMNRDKQNEKYKDCPDQSQSENGSRRCGRHFDAHSEDSDKSMSSAEELFC